MTSSAATPASRLVRGWTAAALSTLAAAASHVMAGSGSLFNAGTLIAFVLSGAVCVGLAGRVLSLARMSAAVLSSQVAEHVLFSLFGPSTSHAGMSPAEHAADHRSGMGAAPVAASGPSDWSLADALLGGGPLMALSHALAAVATILVLRRGEAALSLIAELLGLLLPVLPLAPRVSLGVAPRRLTHAEPAPLTDLALVLSGPGRRGPPLAPLAAFHVSG